MRRLANLSPRQRLLFGGAAATGLVVVIVLILLIASATSDAALDQPIAFDHNKHVYENRIQCQFCHTGVYTSPVAGIPSVENCMGCHGHIATDNPEIVKLTEYWENQEPIPWRRVYKEPSYVYFTHSSHVAAGVSCGACHGDVGNMTVAEKVVDLNMGFCLDCHAEQDNKDALYDCAVCHR
jgi:hypothetical protein